MLLGIVKVWTVTTPALMVVLLKVSVDPFLDTTVPADKSLMLVMARLCCADCVELYTFVYTFEVPHIFFCSVVLVEEVVVVVEVVFVVVVLFDVVVVSEEKELVFKVELEPGDPEFPEFSVAVLVPISGTLGLTGTPLILLAPPSPLWMAEA